MMIIKTTNIEKGRILFYAEQYLSDKSHWGDSEIALPEEENLISQCQNNNDEITISKFQLKLLFQWFTEVTEFGKFLLDEDQIILNKIFTGLSNLDITNDEKIEIIENFLYPEKIRVRSDEIKPETKEKEINTENSISPLNNDSNNQSQVSLPKPKSTFDEKMEKIANEKKENDLSKENLIERIKKQRQEFGDAEKYLNGIIKKTKGKGVF